MALILRIILIVLSLTFLAAVVNSVARKRLMLRYSLLWIVLAFISIFMAVFPDFAAVLAHVLGFEETSNFIFFAVIFFLLLVCLSLSVAVSKYANQIVRLTQNQALLDKRLSEEEQEK